MRILWESVSDSLQSSLGTLDNCLLKFAEFSLSQEQLTKWLKNIEQAMQQHTETKATLQEKKAQLQVFCFFTQVNFFLYFDKNYHNNNFIISLFHYLCLL